MGGESWPLEMAFLFAHLPKTKNASLKREQIERLILNDLPIPSVLTEDGGLGTRAMGWVSHPTHRLNRIGGLKPQNGPGHSVLTCRLHPAGWRKIAKFVAQHSAVHLKKGPGFTAAGSLR